nr:hypothetical protein [Propionibacteriales bacterium]
VVAVEQSGGTGVSSQRRVLVTLPDSVDLVAVLGALRDATVILIRLGG